MIDKTRTRNFWLSFTPFLLVFFLQNGISVFVSELLSVYAFATSTETDPKAFVEAVSKLATSTPVYSTILLLYGVAAFIVTAVWYRAFLAQQKPDFNLKGNAREVWDDAKDSFRGYRKGRIILSCLLIGCTFQIVMNYFMTAVAMLKPDWLQEYQKAMDMSGLGDERLSVPLLIYMVVGPLSEELTFRGLTYGYARRAVSFWAANCIQALLFGIFHMNPLQGIMAFFVGLLLGYIYGHCKNIFVTMAIHLVFNFSSPLLSALPLSKLPPVAFFITIFACLLLTWFGLKLLLSALPVAVSKKDADDPEVGRQ